MRQSQHSLNGVIWGILLGAGGSAIGVIELVCIRCIDYSAYGDDEGVLGHEGFRVCK